MTAKPIVVIQQNEHDAVIASGLTPSDRVVTTGFANLADGSKVIVGKDEQTPSADLAPRKRRSSRDAQGAGKDGEKLARTVAALVKDGYQVTEPSFKRVPAGYPADHPRGELLRCKGLMASRNWKPGPWLQTVEAKERIRGAIKDSKPLTAWLDVQVGPSRLPARPGR